MILRSTPTHFKRCHSLILQQLMWKSSAHTMQEKNTKVILLLSNVPMQPRRCRWWRIPGLQILLCDGGEAPATPVAHIQNIHPTKRKTERGGRQGRASNTHTCRHRERESTPKLTSASSSPDCWWRDDGEERGGELLSFSCCTEKERIPPSSSSGLFNFTPTLLLLWFSSSCRRWAPSSSSPSSSLLLFLLLLFSSLLRLVDCCLLSLPLSFSPLALSMRIFSLLLSQPIRAQRWALQPAPCFPWSCQS